MRWYVYTALEKIVLGNWAESCGRKFAFYLCRSWLEQGLCDCSWYGLHLLVVRCNHRQSHTSKHMVPADRVCIVIRFSVRWLHTWMFCLLFLRRCGKCMFHMGVLQGYLFIYFKTFILKSSRQRGRDRFSTARNFLWVSHMGTPTWVPAFGPPLTDCPGLEHEAGAGIAAETWACTPVGCWRCRWQLWPLHHSAAVTQTYKLLLKNCEGMWFKQSRILIMAILHTYVPGLICIKKWATKVLDPTTCATGLVYSFSSTFGATDCVLRVQEWKMSRLRQVRLARS